MSNEPDPPQVALVVMASALLVVTLVLTVLGLYGMAIIPIYLPVISGAAGLIILAMALVVGARKR